VSRSPIPHIKDTIMRNGLLIVADRTPAAEAIRRELQSTVPYAILGSVDGRQSCAAIVAAARPRVVVFDEMRERHQTLRCIRECRSSVPQAKLVLVTFTLDRRLLADAAAAGIDAAIAKRVQPGNLGALLCEIVEGNVFHAFDQLPPSNKTATAAGLTARETEILTLVTAGASNARIARELWVTQQTVKYHLSNVFRKLGVTNRTEASHYAHVHRIVELETVQGATANAA
jgi:DNA-binding NarL/FixJ family response regulator